MAKHAQVISKGPVEMALAMEKVLRYGRANGSREKFFVGPFNKAKLASSGMILDGDIDGVLAELDSVPNLTISTS
jgi:hypothetical protein